MFLGGDNELVDRLGQVPTFLGEGRVEDAVGVEGAVDEGLAVEVAELTSPPNFCIFLFCLFCFFLPDLEVFEVLLSFFVAAPSSSSVSSGSSTSLYCITSTESMSSTLA